MSLSPESFHEESSSTTYSCKVNDREGFVAVFEAMLGNRGRADKVVASVLESVMPGMALDIKETCALYFDGKKLISRLKEDIENGVLTSIDIIEPAGEAVSGMNNLEVIELVEEKIAKLLHRMNHSGMYLFMTGSVRGKFDPKDLMICSFSHSVDLGLSEEGHNKVDITFKWQNHKVDATSLVRSFYGRYSDESELPKLNEYIKEVGWTDEKILAKLDQLSELLKGTVAEVLAASPKEKLVGQLLEAMGMAPPKSFMSDPVTGAFKEMLDDISTFKHMQHCATCRKKREDQLASGLPPIVFRDDHEVNGSEDN